MKNTANGLPSEDNSIHYEVLDELVEVFLQRRRTGESLTIERFSEEHPTLTSEIREIFPTLLQMEQLGRSEESHLLDPSPGQPNTYSAITSKMENVGSRVGPYIIVSELGEGGFGMVFKVEQTVPMHRFLAMKIIKPGMDSKEVIARFNAERQALAILDHQAIAKIIDGGTAESGRPYFVMELVDGIPISKHCERASLDVRRRVGLFVELCDGVQHAHHRGIIHRDLKPTNILVSQVDDRFTPKIIDFGIAKALSAPLSNDEGLTKISQIIGTPLYMSPEQSRFGATKIDTRSDIFSLGVILYEMLTGRTPIERERLATMNATELQFIIAEEVPPRPSLLCSDVSIDLETIVMKAIAKEPQDRYQSAGEMATDLRLYLDDLPIRARRIGSFERSIRWCRRKPALASLLGILVTLGIGFVATTLFSNSRIRQETEAKSLALLATSKALDEKNEAMEKLEVSLSEQKRLNLLAFQRYYATQLNLAGQAWLTDEPTRAADLLRTVMPSEVVPDIRGFEWYFLNAKIHQGLLRKISIPGEEIIDICFSPDGSRILIVGGTPYTGFADVFDVASGNRVAHLHDESDYVNACAFAPQGDRFGIATGNGSVKFFDSISFKTLHSEMLTIAPKSMAWSPNNDVVVVGSDIGDVRVWTIPDFKAHTVEKAHAGPILRLRFSRDGNSLYSNAEWGGEGTISRKWTIENATMREPTKYPGFSIFGESPNSTQLAAAIRGSIGLLRASDGELLLEKNLSGGSLANAQFSPDGKRLFVGARTERMVREMDTKSLRIVRGYPHRRSVQALAINYEAKLWAAGDASGETSIWELTQPDSGIVAEKSGAKSVQWSESLGGFLLLGGPTVMVGSESPQRRIILTKTSLRNKTEAKSPDTRIDAVSADGTVLVSATKKDNEHFLRVERPDRFGEACFIRLDGAVFEDSLKVSRSGKWLAVRSDPHPVRLFDISSAVPQEKAALDCQAFDIEFSPDETQLVVAGQYGIVEGYDLTNQKLMPRYSGFESLWTWSHAIAFNSDGRFLAVGGDSGDVRVWEVSSRKLIATLSGQSGEVGSLAFFPDNQRLMVGGKSDIRIWNFPLEQELLQLPTEGHSPIAMAIDPTGRRVLTILWGGKVRTWTSIDTHPSN